MTQNIQDLSSEERSHLLLCALSKNTPNSVYFIDREGRFVWVSGAKAKNSGTTISEMVGKTDFDFMSPEDAERSWRDNRRVMETGETIKDKVEKNTRTDGSTVFVAATKSPWYNEAGDMMGAIGISKDITFVHDLIALMVHDIRNPLTSMGATIKLLSRGAYGPVNESVKKTLQDLLQRVGSFEEILKTYLSDEVLANYEIPQTEKLDLRADIIDKIMEEFLLEMEKRKLHFDNILGSIPEGEVVVAESNRNYLTIICRNLLQNSVRFTPEGGIIAIGFERSDGFIKIIFWNNGPPVPQEKWEAIFIEGESTDSTGLGLPMCRELAEKLGGKMWYENRDNHPTFIFTIPC